MSKTLLALAAEEILKTAKKAPPARVAAMEDAAAEFQRVHSYIADCVKDSSVLYAKLARLQGDFRGTELERLITISEEVLSLSSELQSFSREFSEGRFEAVDNPNAGGFDYSGGGGGAPAPAAPPADPAPQAFSSKPEPEKSESDKPEEEEESEEEEDYSGDDED